MLIDHLFESLIATLDRLDASNPEERMQLAGSLRIVRETCQRSVASKEDIDAIAQWCERVKTHTHGRLATSNFGTTWLKRLAQLANARAEQKSAS